MLLREFKLRKDNKIYSLYNSISYFDSKEERFISYNNYKANQTNGFWLCLYKNEFKSDFCLRKIDSRFQYIEYKDNLPLGKFVEINLKNSNITNGYYKQMAYSNENEFITRDTFSRYDMFNGKVEEQIMVSSTEGKSVRDSIWQFKRDEKLKTVEYKEGIENQRQ